MIRIIRNSKFVIRNFQRGMTYVEFIVVLSIFAVMTSVVLFDYGAFQSKVDMKNLASDVALKIVEAQKASVSGKLSTQAFLSKPSYGIHFNSSPSTSFIYFADLSNDKIYNETPLETVNIQKGNIIEKIEYCTGSPSSCSAISSVLSVTFIRPDSRAFFYGDTSELTGFNYIQITIKSPKDITSNIKIYPSGRIQVN